MPDEVDISVETDSQDQPDVEATETGDQTVIVENGESGGGEAVTEAAINHEGRVTALEGVVSSLSDAVTALSEKLESTEFRQEMTDEAVTELATSASETEAALAETIQEDVPEVTEENDDGGILDGTDDAVPTDAREHWWFSRNPFKR